MSDMFAYNPPQQSPNSQYLNYHHYQQQASILLQQQQQLTNNHNFMQDAGSLNKQPGNSYTAESGDRSDDDLDLEEDEDHLAGGIVEEPLCRRQSELLDSRSPAEMGLRREFQLRSQEDISNTSSSTSSNPYSNGNIASTSQIRMDNYYTANSPSASSSRGPFASPSLATFPASYSPLSLGSNSRNTRPMTAPSSTSTSYFHYQPSSHPHQTQYSSSTTLYAPLASAPMAPGLPPFSMTSTDHSDGLERYGGFDEPVTLRHTVGNGSNMHHHTIPSIADDGSSYGEVSSGIGRGVIHQNHHHHQHATRSFDATTHTTSSSEYSDSRPTTADPAYLITKPGTRTSSFDAVLEDDLGASEDEDEAEEADSTLSPRHNGSVDAFIAKSMGSKSRKSFSFVPTPGVATKRPRRKFEEIERLYTCDYSGCDKAYGTLNHLNSHKTMQKHGPKSSPARKFLLRSNYSASFDERQLC